MKPLDPAAAARFAGWFRCLSDPTRLRVLNAVAVAGRPLSVGEVVEAVGVGQSTVSHHLKVLAETCFVTLTPQGTSTLVALDACCLEAFPTAAELVLGTAELAATPGGADRG